MHIFVKVQVPVDDSSLNWVDSEFQHTKLCDKRLDARLLLIAKRLAAQPCPFYSGQPRISTIKIDRKQNSWI